MGKRVLAGVILGVLTVTACGQAGGQANTPGSAPASPPTTQASPSASDAAKQNLASIVHTACGPTIPAVITAAIPQAKPTYTAHYALGSSCQWHTDDLSHRALVVAVTSAPYIGWRRMQASLTDSTTVAGYSAVRGHVADGCTVLVDVHEVALDVELNGVADPTCQTTTELAAQVLSNQG